MYLLQTKAVTMLFMVLIFMNWPVYMFFYASNEAIPTKATDYFMKFSLGNMGAAELSCVSANWATTAEI
jgi:hypothetical protein